MLTKKNNIIEKKDQRSKSKPENHVNVDNRTRSLF